MRKQNRKEAIIQRNVSKSSEKEVLKNRSEKPWRIQQQSEENSEIMLRLSSETKVDAFSRTFKNQRKVKTKTMPNEVKVEPKVMPKRMQNECKSEQQGDAEK